MASAADRLADPGVSDPPPARVPWATIALVLALLILCYAPVLRLLVWQWDHDADMGHGFFVPVIAGYIAWQRRAALLSTPAIPNYWGVAIMVYGALQLLLGSLVAELFLQRTAFIISLTGAILTVGGTRILRILAFPLVLLCFMVPIPVVVYGQITFPLQQFATRVAEASLSALGIPVLREGNILELASQKLSVVEACSGIRSLLSLTFLSLVYAYFFDKKPWMRWVLLLAVIPIAIVANAGRVTMTGIISEWRTDLAQGFFHSLEGWLIFVIAMAFMVITHRMIDGAYKVYRAKHIAA